MTVAGIATVTLLVLVTATAILKAVIAFGRAMRRRAAATLGRLGTRSALPPLLEAVEPRHPPVLRAMAARALGDVGAVASAPALGALLADPQHEVAHAVTHAVTHAAAYAREALALADVDERRRIGALVGAAVNR